MSEKKSEGQKVEETDAELAELLDSALADFSSDPIKKDDAKTVEESNNVQEVNEELDEQQWAQDMIRQAAEQFETNINALLGSSGSENSLTAEQVQQSFQKMAEAAQQALTNPGVEEPSSNDFASAISHTLQGLSEGTENLQNPFSEADVMSMFSNMGGSGEQNAFLPFMQGMMQSLLSKEVLYPSLKDILAKYPPWLQENEATLSTEDKERYQKQQVLMQKVCAELEMESESDSADVKRARFDKVLNLMQSLQDLGQPPTDIVADAGPTLPFDAQGNPDQCSLM